MHSEIDVNLEDRDGETALFAALKSLLRVFAWEHLHCIRTMEHLLRHGVDTSLKDRDGQTVLRPAAVCSPEGVKLLLQHGIVNGRLKNRERKLVFDEACESGPLDSLYLLFFRAMEDSTVTFFEWRASQK